MSTRFAPVLVSIVLGACGGTNSRPQADVADAGDADFVDVTVDGGPAEVETACEAEVWHDVTNNANLFLNNPVRDDWKTSRVVVTGVDDPEGLMTGPYANVFNCPNEEGGWTKEYELPFLGLTKLALCNIAKTVKPDPDASYLSVTVPKDLLDPGDGFAELMAFYHVNAIHDYYKGVHGFEGMDFPLETYVNLMAYIEMENPLEGIPSGWVTFDNAMFMPGESFEALEEMAEDALKEFLGIEDDLAIPFKNDAIMFMQGEKVDFAYDADVIYHEYTHAVVGGDRLWGYGVDEYGLDAAPTAINEAYADYFACSVLGDPITGEFALGTLTNSDGRDISQFRKCPDGYAGEPHIDGLMYSSALWEIHEALGQETADTIIFNALLTFGKHTCFEEAALATIAEAALLNPPKDAEVSAIFDKHGLLGCNNRTRPYKDIDPAADSPLYLPGTQSTGVGAFSAQAPAYVQFELDVAEGTTALLVQTTGEPSGMEGILMGLLGMGEVKLALALSNDGPITYTYGDEEYESTAEAVVPLDKTGENLHQVTIYGDCLKPGKHHLQLMNLSANEVRLTLVKVIQATNGVEPEVNYSCVQE